MNIVVDTSAFLAIMQNEPERYRALTAITQAGRRLTSVATVFEAHIVLECRYGRQGVALYDQFLHQHDIRTVPFQEVHLRAAGEGFRRFGKGLGQPGLSRLNMGDCFSYALAKVSGYTLVFKGDDFGVTDLNLLRLDVP
ncbi:MAG: type II toxin-antitoxin system VapC family toxin [Myxococcota bacterium]